MTRECSIKINKTVILKHVALLPELKVNLISGSALQREKYQFSSKGDGKESKIIICRDEIEVASFPLQGSLYIHNIENLHSSISPAHQVHFVDEDEEIELSDYDSN